MTGNTKNSYLTITVGAYFLLSGHNIYKIFDRNINSGYVHIWKNTHKVITCLSYGTHHLFNFFSTKHISKLVTTCDFYHVHYELPKTAKGRVKLYVRNSNHLVLRKCHKRRGMILKITCQKIQMYKRNKTGNRNYMYENLTMC